MQSDTATRRAIRHDGVWVELERCKDCRAHAYCTSHQEEKYDRYEKMVTAALHGKCPVEVNPGPRSMGARLRQVKYNPILFQAQRPRNSKEDCLIETLRYPRLGAFELWVCYGARREEVFSKLKSQRWPKLEVVLERLEEVANNFGGWNGVDDDAYLPAAALSSMSTSAPAPAALSAPNSMLTSMPEPAAASSPNSLQRITTLQSVNSIATPACYAPTSEEETRGLEMVLEEAHTIFRTLDRDSSNHVSKIELIRGLKSSELVREFFGLPAQIRQEDAVTRRRLEDIFQGIDKDNNKSLTWDELELWIKDNPSRWQRNGRPDSPVADSEQLAIAASEPTAPAKPFSAQRPPLPQDVAHEAIVHQPAYDKKYSVSNFSTAASSTDLRAQIQRPLSATSSDVSMLSQPTPVGLSRPASEQLMVPELEEASHAQRAVADLQSDSMQGGAELTQLLKPEGADADLQREVTQELEKPQSAAADLQREIMQDGGAELSQLLKSQASASADEKDEYSECFEASMSHSALGAEHTAAAAAPPESSVVGAALATTAETPLPADDDYGEYSAEFEASASTSAIAGLQGTSPGPQAPMAPAASQAEAAATAAPVQTLAPEAQTPATMAAAASPPAAPAAAVGIGGPGPASHTQDLQPSMDRSEYSGFEASDLGLSALAADAPAATSAPALATANAESGAVSKEELQATSPSKGSPYLDTDDYSYGFEASLAGGGSLQITLGHADQRPTVTLLDGDGDAEADDESPSSLSAMRARAGQPGQPFVNMEASADDYSEFEDGNEESMN